MSFNALSLAKLGIGFGALAVASIGLLSPTQVEIVTPWEEPKVYRIILVELDARDVTFQTYTRLTLLQSEAVVTLDAIQDITLATPQARITTYPVRRTTVI